MTTPAARPSAFLRPVRVVHVLRAMNRAGIETWLMEVMRRQDPQIQYELLLNTSATPDEYEPELRQLGIVIRRCPPTRQFPAYIRCLWRTFRHGRYDVVHTHVHHFSGLIVLVAWLAGIQGRLVHSHFDSRQLDRAAGPARQLYQRVMDTLITRLSTSGVAVSEPAAASLFGPAWQTQHKYEIIPLGLNTPAYRQPTDRAATRASLGLAAASPVFGHVGGFRAEKNHAFLLEVFAQIVSRCPEARLLLVGTGELLEPVRELARTLGLQNVVVFAGSRGDVPALLQAMDTFLWPSHAEGLGLALIEAQLSGLPCVAAQHLPAEALLPGTDLTLLPLGAGAAAWAGAALDAARRPRRYPLACPYDQELSMARFTEIYGRYSR